MRFEDAILFLGRKSGVQRKNLQIVRAMSLPPTQHRGRFANVTFGREEHQHITRLFPQQFVDGGGDLIGEFRLRFIGQQFRRTVSDLDRIRATGDFDHGRLAGNQLEVITEPGGVNRRGGDDASQLGSLGE